MIKTQSSPMLLLTIVFGFTNCTQSSLKKEGSFTEERKIPVDESSGNAFINPPLKNINVPVAKYTIAAEKGDTIFSLKGSVILFPKNAFVDANGNPVKGKVDITYREFSDPVDLFISGIPMNYDSAGSNFTFESASMCEIYAYQNDLHVFVNQKNKPEINLSSSTKDKSFNLYYLDTIQKKWRYEGKDNVSLVRSVISPSLKAPKREVDLSEPPMKPIEADDKQLLLNLEVDPSSVPEYLIYDKMQFEIVKIYGAFNLSDTSFTWSDMKMRNTEEKGVYNLFFMSKDKRLSVDVMPVFRGKNYEEAMKIYEMKMQQYNDIRIRRESVVKQINDSVAKENEEIARVNLFVEAKNRAIDSLNEKITIANAKQIEIIKKRKEELKKYNKEITEQRKAQIKLLEEQWKQDSIRNAEKIADYRANLAENERESYSRGGNMMKYRIVRTFNINGFGAWNCDRPLQNSYVVKTLLPVFKDKSDNDIKLSTISVVYTYPRSLFNYAGNEMEFIANSPSSALIFGVVDTKFAYLKIDDVADYCTDQRKREYTFKMNVYPGEITSDSDIRRIVGI